MLGDDFSATALDPLLSLARQLQDVEAETFDTVAYMLDVVANLTHCVAGANDRLQSGDTFEDIERSVEFNVVRYQLLAGELCYDIIT